MRYEGHSWLQVQCRYHFYRSIRVSVICDFTNIGRDNVENDNRSAKWDHYLDNRASRSLQNPNHILTEVGVELRLSKGWECDERRWVCGHIRNFSKR